ncbi:hypothetical protein, partial [Paenibacillus borealis]
CLSISKMTISNFQILVPIFSNVSQVKLRNKASKVGQNVNALFQFPLRLFNSPFIIIISNASCSVCYENLERLLNEHATENLPLTSLLGSESETPLKEKFHQQFQSRISIFDIEDNLLANNGFPIAPYYLLVDSKGNIIKGSAIFDSVVEDWRRFSGKL